jgi:hypothetical protein
VANTRLEQHVEKGNDDGLYISSVACCQELWALIMDAGTGFTAQVHNLSNQFLPKVSHQEVWTFSEGGFFHNKYPLAGMDHGKVGGRILYHRNGWFNDG